MILRRYIHRSRRTGFSLFELLTSVSIILILGAIAIPTLTTTITTYRLGSTTEQLANLMELARFSAINHNTTVNVLTTFQGNNTVFFVDLSADKNGTLQPGDPQVVLPSDMLIANGQSGVPAASTTGLPSTQDFTSQIMFDYRGTVTTSGGGLASSACYLAIGMVSQPQYGFRAVTVSPMGQTKTWSAGANGQWKAM
jgi:prepilin-type N-terminal cleavage/methylation domain-containing protein